MRITQTAFLLAFRCYRIYIVCSMTTGFDYTFHYRLHPVFIKPFCKHSNIFWSIPTSWERIPSLAAVSVDTAVDDGSHMYADTLHVTGCALSLLGIFLPHLRTNNVSLSSLCRVIEKLKCVGSLALQLHQRNSFSMSSGVWQLVFMSSLTTLTLFYFFTAAPSVLFKTKRLQSYYTTASDTAAEIKYCFFAFMHTQIVSLSWKTIIIVIIIIIIKDDGTSW